MGKGEAEIVVDETARKLRINYLRGAFRGTQTVSVQDGNIRARWEIEFAGIYLLMQGRIAGHFRAGTRHALDRSCSGRVTE